MSQYIEPKGYLKVRLFYILKHPIFDIFIIILIIGNIVTMALDTDDQSLQTTQNLLHINYFFTGIFILESVLKIYVLDFKNYIINSWNQ
jgi:hypothetical protein